MVGLITTMASILAFIWNNTMLSSSPLSSYNCSSLSLKSYFRREWSKRKDRSLRKSRGGLDVDSCKRFGEPYSCVDTEDIIDEQLDRRVRSFRGGGKVNAGGGGGGGKESNDKVEEVMVSTEDEAGDKVTGGGGRLGFIEGLRLIVPVVNSESKPLLSSDKQPLEEEEEARDMRPPLDEFDILDIADETLPHCDGTAEDILLIDSLRIETAKLLCETPSPPILNSSNKLL
uniref:Uncharacterized protein n=1 Tax=Glossina pallidipes TaxID=7398 RepID=A0A1B0AC01_GLOPL